MKIFRKEKNRFEKSIVFFDKFKFRYKRMLQENRPSKETPHKDSRYYDSIDCNALRPDPYGLDFYEVPPSTFMTDSRSDSTYFYGNMHILRGFAGLSDFYRTDIGIQHGILYDLVCERDAGRHLSLAWGKHTLDTLKVQYSIDIVPIGAPFFYTEGFNSESFVQDERRRLGKNLLFFPAHSHHYTLAHFDSDVIFESLKKQKDNFDSIRVCMYWKDIQRDMHLPYIEAGYECVSAGHVFDYTFLPKLKSLLEISDASMSNALGSHVGYSVYMNKPHLLEKTLVRYENAHNDPLEWQASSATGPIEEAFATNTEFAITQEQLDIVAEFWGTDCIKTKEEMREIFRGDYEKYIL